MLRRRVLALAAGVLLSLAFEPVAVAYVIPVAVAGFVIVTRGLRWRSAYSTGLIFGAGFFFTHIFWMREVGIPAWIALATLEALFYGVGGVLSAYVQRHRLWPLWFAASWTLIEVWRSGWPLNGFPWGRLAFAVIDTPVAQSLPYAGAVGVSFLLALLGALLAWLVAAPYVGPVASERHRGRAALALAGLVALLAVPVAAPWQVHEDGTLQVAAVQGNVPGPGDDILYDFRQVTQNHVDATVDLAAQVAAGTAPRPDFVLWPENSTATDPFADEQTNSAIRIASEAIGVPILVGVIADGGPNQVLNQGIVWDPVTGAGQRYTKRNPVPFGEYIPLRSVFTKYNFFDRLREVGRDMLTGTRSTPLDIAGVPVADSICYDIAYDDGIQKQIADGARLMVVQSSNATFIRTHQIEQQFAITRVRALETGRWVAVATTNGVSGIIAPDGSVVAEAKPRTQAVLDAQVGLVSGLTPAMRISPWAGWAALALTILGLVVVRLTYRRPQGRAAPTPAAGATQAAPELESSTAGGTT